MLSAYCKNLTGIKQADVDKSLELKEVLKKFDEWIQRFIVEKKLIFQNGDDETKQNAAICTWTDFDVGVYLKGECERKSIELPSYFKRRIDASQTFQVLKVRMNLGHFRLQMDVSEMATQLQTSQIYPCSTTSWYSLHWSFTFWH